MSHCAEEGFPCLFQGLKEVTLLGVKLSDSVSLSPWWQKTRAASSITLQEQKSISPHWLVSPFTWEENLPQRPLADVPLHLISWN